MVHMKNVIQNKQTALYRLGTDSWVEEKKQLHKEQSQLLGEHRPFALRKPGKDSQKELEQAALYLANG